MLSSRDAVICVSAFVSLQVSALLCAGGVDNLNVLDRASLKPAPTKNPSGQMPDGQIRWRVGEAEFESLMRMLDNLVSGL